MGDVLMYSAAERILEADHAIETVAFDGTDEVFGMGIEVRAARRLAT
ncbi:MAG: hypothetical protein L0228_15200 [Planctomycetes bacterium]|nr:hypothetical protein [Planctomycetota bacterium]